MKEKKEVEKKQSVTEILAEQLRKILTDSGITNLHVKDDGSLAGETNNISYYPTTHYLGDIKLEVIDGKLKINAKVTGSSENTGSVI